MSQDSQSADQDGVETREPGADSESGGKARRSKDASSERGSERKKRKRVVRRVTRRKKKGETSEPLGEGDTVEYRINEDGKKVKVIRRVRRVKKKKKKASPEGSERKKRKAETSGDAVKPAAPTSDADEPKVEKQPAASDDAIAKASESALPEAEPLPEADALPETKTVAEVANESAAAEVKSEASDADVKSEASDAEVKSEASDAEVKAEASDADVKAEASDAEVKAEASDAEVKAEASDETERPRKKKRRRRKKRRGTASERAEAVSHASASASEGEPVARTDDELEPRKKKKKTRETGEPKKKTAKRKAPSDGSSDLAAAFAVEADREDLEDAIGRERFEDSHLAVELDAMPTSSRIGDKPTHSRAERLHKGGLLESSETLVKPTRSRRLKSTRSSDSWAPASDNGNGNGSAIDEVDEERPRRKGGKRRKGHRRRERSSEKLAIASADLLDGPDIEELDESDFAGLEDSPASAREDDSDLDRDSSDDEPLSGSASESRSRIAAAWGKPKQTVVSRGKKGPSAKRRSDRVVAPKRRARSDAEIAADLPGLRRRGGNKMLVPMIIIGVAVVGLVGTLIVVSSSQSPGKSVRELAAESGLAETDALREHAKALLAEAEQFYADHPERPTEARAKFLAIQDALDAIRRRSRGNNVIHAAEDVRDKVADRLASIDRERDDAGHSAYEALRERAEQKASAGDFVGASAVFDEFPVHLRDLRWWQQNVRADRERFARGAVAREEAAPLIARAKELAGEKRYEEALGVLAAFSDTLRGTKGYDEISQTRHGIRNREIKLAEAAEARAAARERLQQTGQAQAAKAEIAAEIEKKFADAQWEPLLGEDLFNWQIRNPQNATWKLEGGVLKGNNTVGTDMMIGMRKDWKDYVLQFRARVVKGTYGAACRLNLVPTGGGFRIQMRGAQMPAPDAEWHRIQLWVVGDAVMASVDGGEKQPVNVQDQQPAPEGGIGFLVPAGAHIELSEIQVKVLESGS